MPLLDDLPLDLPSLGEAVSRRETLRERGEKLVLTNGCFDLLHAGHLYFLEQASALGDQLWIALNSDRSASCLKGPARPVQSERERAYALLSLHSVAGVVLFEEKRLVREILALYPDIYAKAGDYELDTLDSEERVALEEVGADIRFLPFLDGCGTTSLIERIKSLPDT